MQEDVESVGPDEPAGRLARLTTQAASGRRMSNVLTGARFNQYDPGTAPPDLRFLSGMTDPAAARPNLDLVKDALGKAEQLASHHDRLTMFWIAIREHQRRHSL